MYNLNSNPNVNLALQEMSKLLCDGHCSFWTSRQPSRQEINNRCHEASTIDPETFQGRNLSCTRKIKSSDVATRDEMFTWLLPKWYFDYDCFRR